MPREGLHRPYGLSLLRGARNRERSYEHESQLVRAAQAAGLEARRAWGSNGKAIGLAADVDIDIEGHHVQAKRRKKLPAYLQIPDSCEAVAFRQDRGENLVLIRLPTYLEYLKCGKQT